MRACLRGSRVFMLTVYICVCHICFRQSIFSQAVGGRVLMGARLSRKLPESIRKRDSPSRCIEGGGYPWHHSHSPTVSLTLLLHLFLLYPIVLCLCAVCMCIKCVWVPVFCRLGKLFPHLPWLASKTLQPWGSHPPHTAPACTSSFSDYLGSHWQSIVCYTDMPFSTGAPNSTSGPPWITNAPTVGPQTAHCLSYAIFFFLS